MPVLRRSLNRHPHGSEEGPSVLDAVRSVDSNELRQLPDQRSNRQSLFKYYRTWICIAVVLIVAIVFAILFYKTDNRDPEKMYQHMLALWRGGADRTVIEQAVGKPQMFSYCDVCGDSPPTRRFSSSNSWIVIRDYTATKCRVYLISVYYWGDGKIVDIEMQSEEITKLTLSDHYNYLVHGHFTVITRKMTIKTKSPF